GTETRGPAESECETDHECAYGSAAALHAVQTSVGIERFDLENAGQVQPEENNDDTRYSGQRVFVDPEQLANLGRGRSQHDKNYAEAEDESDRVHHHPPHQVRLRRLQLFQAGTR